ncbi:MAG: LCP family protein, partial [Firmicutes bacterium]|nr:LCP family protein [Bacillota bacterium]
MRLKHKLIGLFIAICLLAVPFTALAAEKTNPLIFPTETIEYTAYPDTIINILLLGIDLGREGYWGSALKDRITDCHTDAVMVVAINLTQNRIDIISIPRDTVTIVPGVRGVYKLNAAVNCADTLAEGLERTQASVEKLLGGIKIAGYFAVDMAAMFTLGDALGGIEYDVDMNYYGDSGRKYSRGLQHLDGQGIMDYVRVRKNATIDGTDLGRTRRQREMMTAILQKLARDSGSALRVLDALANPANGVFTNMSGAKAVGFASLSSLLLQGGDLQINSYTMEGGYSYAMKWNFTFTDEEARAEILQTVYGVEMPRLQYVSRKHADFYADTGFYSMHLINICTELTKDLQG